MSPCYRSDKLKPFWLSIAEKESLPVLEFLSAALLSAEYERALHRALAMPECKVVPFFGAFLRELREIVHDTPSLVVLAPSSASPSPTVAAAAGHAPTASAAGLAAGDGRLEVSDPAAAQAATPAAKATASTSTSTSTPRHSGHSGGAGFPGPQGLHSLHGLHSQAHGPHRGHKQKDRPVVKRLACTRTLCTECTKHDVDPGVPSRSPPPCL